MELHPNGCSISPLPIDFTETKMQPYEYQENFVGRSQELNILTEIDHAPQAGILVTYGRRRIGKTALMEKAFQGPNLLKFEGLEDEPEFVQ